MCLFHSEMDCCDYQAIVVEKEMCVHKILVENVFQEDFFLKRHFEQQHVAGSLIGWTQPTMNNTIEGIQEKAQHWLTRWMNFCPWTVLYKTKGWRSIMWAEEMIRIQSFGEGPIVIQMLHQIPTAQWNRCQRNISRIHWSRCSTDMQTCQRTSNIL